VNCLHCGNALGLLARFRDELFCNREHERAYDATLVERLREWKQRVKPARHEVPADRPAPTVAAA
jgi:hypothetical protein